MINSLAVDTSLAGSYSVTYDSTDAAGNVATQVIRTINVSDTISPIITVVPLEVDIELNSASPVLLDGVTTDDGSPITTTGTVDPTTLGDYIITYDSTDAAGNVATPITRTYHVVDTTAPITITPNFMDEGTSVDVVISGSGFVLDAFVSLSGGASPTPNVSNVVVDEDANTIKATITTKDAGPPRDRFWDVTVTNPDGSSSTLVDGFTVKPI